MLSNYKKILLKSVNFWQDVVSLRPQTLLYGNPF
jgi:hypothetical protein